MGEALREGVQPIVGVPINDKRFQARMRFSTLRNMIRDPRDLETNHSKREQDRDPALEAIYHIRETAQRPVKGKKQENIASYARFIEQLHENPEIGCTPAIHLWSETRFHFEDGALTGPSYIEIDNEAIVVILDGETQYMARRNAGSRVAEISREIIPVEIHHGRSKQWAGEAFYCMNVLGVTASPNTSMSLHKSDALVQMVYTLEQTIPLFREPGAIKAGGGGLDKGSIVLFNALRQSVAAFFLGRKATQIGAKDISEEDTAQLTPERMEACTQWFRLFTETLAQAYKEGKKSMATQATVWVALGLYGHEALNRGTIAAGAPDELAELRAINWSRGTHWLDIALSRSPKGKLSVANVKGYAVPTYEAISPDAFADARRKNPDMPDCYQQIRTKDVAQAA